MGNPIRNASPEVIHHVTVRTANRTMWWLPNHAYRELFGGILARYQEKYEIELFAYMFLSNHYHLLVRAPKSNLHEFTRDLNREISRRVNYLNAREGRMYGRRYTDQECVRWTVWEPGDGALTGEQLVHEDDTVSCMLYILTNPTHHGLLANSKDWPGLNGYQHVLDGKDRTYKFQHHSKRGTDEEWESHTLRISYLPYFKRMNKVRRSELIEALLKTKTREITKERKEQGKTSYLGIQGIRKCLKGEEPMPVEKSPRLPCYSLCKDAIREFMESYRILYNQHAEASLLFRQKRYAEAKFPPFTIPPPVHHAPRKGPFNNVCEYAQLFCS